MNFKISRFALGFWRAAKWNYSDAQLDELVQKSINFGITTFDHADIYGDYQCELLFGEVLKRSPSLRNQIEIVTKCGIKLISAKRPENTFHCYDTSKLHLIKSAETSIKNLSTDYIDVLLIHRPDPLMNADEIAEAFYELKKSGKVLHFGVSNFLPHQFSLLQSRLDFPLVTNQIEVSVLNTEHFDNGNIDFLQEKRVSPMVWSPFAGGRVFWENGDQANRVRNVLNELAYKYNAGIDAMAVSWLLNHPVKFNIVLGTGKIERIKSLQSAINIELTKEEWFKIWVASKGFDVS